MNVFLNSDKIEIFSAYIEVIELHFKKKIYIVSTLTFLKLYESTIGCIEHIQT